MYARPVPLLATSGPILGARADRTIRLRGGDVTAEDVARGYCQLCKAESEGRFKDVTGEIL